MVAWARARWVRVNWARVDWARVGGEERINMAEALVPNVKPSVKLDTYGQANISSSLGDKGTQRSVVMHNV